MRVRRGVLVDKTRRVGPTREVVEVDPTRLHQAMDQRQDQKPVRARRDPVPVVGHGVVAGADGIDPDHLGPARLELADAHLDRVRIVILGHAEEQEELGAVPVGLAELPERAADGIDTGRRHVDRAEAAVRRVVRRAEALRPVAREALALVAAGEERQLRRVGLAQRLHPRDREVERLVPADFLELARSARADTAQRRAQAGRRGVLHDPGAALGAKDATIDRVVAVAVDIGDFAVLQVHVDATAAGAHVAGRLPDLVRNRRRCVDDRFARHCEGFNILQSIVKVPSAASCGLGDRPVTCVFRDRPSAREAGSRETGALENCEHPRERAHDLCLRATALPSGQDL